MFADCGAKRGFVSREPNNGMQSSPFRLQPTATVIHNVPKRRPDFITLNQYSRRNQSCENQILLFLLKTKLVSVSPLNYTIGGVCPFFSLLLPDFFTIFLHFLLALDTTSPLPLFNSLTHLTYLTSTSPRIREIMTMDGGLERLVRILHEFCICPAPPENPAILYGLIPPNSRPPKLAPALNPHSFDKHAAYRFSLAFQCVVNIGVRGSEPIRSRVVQAGTLDVVGCILEAWLANKGFAVGPSSSATGIPRESREQRQQRRLAQMEQRQREEAAHLQRALQRQLQVEQSQQYRSSRGSQRQDRYSRIDDQVSAFFFFYPIIFYIFNRMILWIILLPRVQHHTFYSFPIL